MMHLSSAIAVLMIVVAAASAGLYPATMGNKGAAVGRTKSGTNRDTSGDSYHMQSSDGQYVFGHTNSEQGRAEMRDSDGTVTGYYSYTDRDGRVVRVDYVADKGGYRVISNSGVQSASVTVQADGGGAPAAQKDFRKMYTDLTRRIKNTVVQRGQKVMDPTGEGQQPIVVDPIPYPTEETKHSNSEEKINFPDWSQVKISSTQKPMDGIEHSEGQQQQETVDPNLDSVKITTQKSNIKGNENDGKVSIDELENGMITTEMPSVPLVSIQPQTTISGVKQFDEYSTAVVSESATEHYRTIKENEDKIKISTETDVLVTIKPLQDNESFKNVQTTVEPSRQTDVQVPTKGDRKGGYSDTVSHEDQVKEITTEVRNPMIGAESTVIDDTENNSPVTKPISIISDVQTTVSYYDRPGQTTESSDDRLAFQTTISGVKQFDEYSTAVVSESATEHYRTIKENEDKIKISTETDVLVTIKPLQDNESFKNLQTTVEPSRQTDVQTTGVPSSVDSTTIETVNGNPALVSTVRPLYESDITTSQTGGRVGDTETATAVDAAGIQYVTEQNNNNEDRPEFRTLEPTESIGTTIRPDFKNSQQELQDIVWPEIPQEPVPQVLVPLDPYPAENLQPKNSGVKTRPNDSRLVRDNKPDELKSAVNISEIEATTMIISNDEENGAMFNFPKYYLIG